MLTGKQRSYLRKLGQDEEPLVFIGKNDLTETVVREMDNLLTARELVKAKIQDTSTLDAKETANQLAEMLGAEYVQAIGRRFVQEITVGAKAIFASDGILENGGFKRSEREGHITAEKDKEANARKVSEDVPHRI